MEIDEQQLRSYFIKSGIISKEKLESAIREAKKKKVSYTEMIVKKNLVSDEQLGQIISDISGYPYVNLGKILISDEVLRLIPEITAKHKRIMVFEKNVNGLKLAMNHPDDLETIGILQKRTGEK